MKRLLIFFGCLLVAFWPVWIWYGERTTDGSDEPYGILALVAGFWLVWRDRSLLHFSERNCFVAGGLLVGYAAAAPFLPDLVSAIVAVGILALASGSWRKNPGIWIVFALSLPMIASLQFYLGYPLRWIAASGAEVILQTAGMEVGRSGTNLLWKGNTVGVDPPCSGVEMLWTGLFLVAFFSAYRKYQIGRCSLIMAAGAVAIVVANCLRVTLLFVKESGLLNLPEWTHDGIGILLFVALVLLAEKCFSAQSGRATTTAPRESPTSPPGLPLSFVIVAALGVAVLPFVPNSEAGVKMEHTPFPGWPERWEGKYLEQLPLSEAEASFAENFPGKIGVFSNGPDKIILRWVTRPTRKLHSSADCLRASGYTIEEERAGAFVAWNEDAVYRIEEKISNELRDWSGVSQWFWSASLSQAEGPWWASTMIRVY